MNIGFIGYGEVGKEMSKGLSNYNVDNIFAFDPLIKNKSPEKLSERTKITFFQNTKELLMKPIEILFVAVPATKAFEAWSDIKDNINKNTLLVDLTTASSNEKKEIDELLATKNLNVLDAAILGALKVYQNKVPILVSGKNSHQFIELGSSMGMNITVLNNNVGDATNFKYIRSIFTKGLLTLLYEVMESAEKLGIKEEIFDSITETMDKDNFSEIIDRYIKSNVKHSKRREKEMENASNFMQQNDIKPYMTDATINKLKEITHANLENALPFENYTWKQVIETFSQK